MKQASTENTVSPGSALRGQTHTFMNYVVYYDRLEDQNCGWQRRISNFHSLPRLLVYIHHIDTAIIIVNQKGWAGIHPLSNAVNKLTPDCSAEAAVTWLLHDLV